METKPEGEGRESREERVVITPPLRAGSHSTRQPRRSTGMEGVSSQRSGCSRTKAGVCLSSWLLNLHKGSPVPRLVWGWYSHPSPLLFLARARTHPSSLHLPSSSATVERVERLQECLPAWQSSCPIPASAEAGPLPNPGSLLQGPKGVSALVGAKGPNMGSSPCVIGMLGLYPLAHLQNLHFPLGTALPHEP